MSSDIPVRDWLQEQLTPLLPPSWQIIPNQVMPQTLSRITVVIKHLEMERLAEAPLGSLRHQIILTVADPHEDQVKAENALDDEVLKLCTALDSLDGLTWTGAKKVAVRDPYIGWDITLTVISTKKKE